MKKAYKKPVTDENFIVIPDNLGDAPDDSLLVLQDEGNNKSEGGIYLPDMSVEKPDTGIVVRLGDRSDGKPVKYKLGDHILWGEEAGRQLNIRGVIYLLIRYKDILWNYKQ
jgi:chaperonin GroES